MAAPTNRPGDQTMDVEKTGVVESSFSASPDRTETRKSAFKRWNDRIENLAGFEARGLARVPPDEREIPVGGHLQMFMIWFSANTTIVVLAVGLTGPLVFQLGFLDSAMCAVFGTMLGAATTAYMSTYGAMSGNRTMVVARFFFGYYPSKLCTFLQIILMEGYGLLSCIIGGQVLSGVSEESMSIAVGVVIVAILVCLFAAFGIRMFNVYERYAWIPHVLAFCILIGAAGPKFNASLAPAATGKTLAANRLSFFSLMYYLPNSWAGAASDYYVYYPENTPKWKPFLLTFAGLTLSIGGVDLIGIGVATGVASHPSWGEAFGISSGSLIVECFRPLGDFGKFCAVIVALGVVANDIMGTYSAAIGCQIMGRWGQRVPRWIWVIVLACIQLVCGVAGRTQLFIIFTNFLALMAYWLTFMVCIIAEEHLFFKRRLPQIDWDAWHDPKQMPIGIAALVSFLIGWVGAILGMYQIYFVGPLAKLSGWSDVGLWVGVGFTLITFPPLRWLEVKKVGR